MNTADKIDLLFEAKEQLATIDTRKQELIDQVITPELKAKLEEARSQIITKEIQQKLDDIEVEFGDYAKNVKGNIDKFDAEIRSEVLEAGRTIKSASEEHMAVYRKGSSSWDGTKLLGYAAAHPEILEFHSTGKPSVAIK